MYTSTFYLQTKYHLINFLDFLIYKHAIRVILCQFIIKIHNQYHVYDFG